jgi:16S rRNA (cytosine1402-N4)-methyltransferase
VGKPVRASANEVDQNPRARSAILRVAERVIVDREVA